MDREFEFLATVSTDEVEALLTDPQWEEDVAKAAFFGASVARKPGFSFDDMLMDIINYNIGKRIRGLLLTKIKKPLPKSMTLTDPIQGYNFLEEMTIYASLLKADNQLGKPLKVALKITDIEVEKRLDRWCELLQKEFSPISIEYKAKNKNSYIISYS